MTNGHRKKENKFCEWNSVFGSVNTFPVKSFNLPIMSAYQCVNCKIDADVKNGAHGEGCYVYYCGKCNMLVKVDCNHTNPEIFGSGIPEPKVMTPEEQHNMIKNLKCDIINSHIASNRDLLSELLIENEFLNNLKNELCGVSKIKNSEYEKFSETYKQYLHDRINISVIPQKVFIEKNKKDNEEDKALIDSLNKIID